MNNAHEAINFTIEKEKKDKLAFLDVKVKRKENIFLTSVYRKKTFTGFYLNFQLNRILKIKKNLIKTLCHRAYRICSPEMLSNEKD